VLGRERWRGWSTCVDLEKHGDLDEDVAQLLVRRPRLKARMEIVKELRVEVADHLDVGEQILELLQFDLARILSPPKGKERAELSVEESHG
jgi:hypothetical protein